MTTNEGEQYLKKCININKKISVDKITDKTINGDTYKTLSFLPESFVDLLIADPPYNLDKDFHG